MTELRHSLLEEQRLEKLYSLCILDTPDETAFNQIADDLGFTLGLPHVMINFVDRNRVWFKACIQVEDRIDASECPRPVAFCSYTIQSEDALIIEDMLKDEYFRDNPLVTHEPHIRAYAGVPLITDDGFRIGTICGMDFVPRTFTDRDIEHLHRAARRVMSELDQRLLRREYQQVMGELQTIMSASPGGFLLLDEQGCVAGDNPAVCTITGRQWQIGEKFVMDHLQLDPEKSVFESIYSRVVGSGWFTVTRVKVGLRRALLVFEDVTDHIQYQQSLSEMAYTDQLTSLPNRNAFYGALESSLHQENMAVAFLDLDGFKQVNDTHGHHAGDALLREVARRLGQAIRVSDQVFRLAGDEFTLILKGDVEAESLHGVAKRILQNIQQPFWFEGQQIPFGASLGLTLPQPGDSVDGLLSRADGLMYQVKTSGKNNYLLG